jgi:hypothetical protein
MTRSSGFGPRPARARGLAAIGLWLAATAATAGGHQAALARGDAAWAERAAERRGARADPGSIGRAVTAYEEAVVAAPDSIAARERLLRALFFQGRFAAGEAEAGEIYLAARELAEEGLARLAAELGRREPFDRGDAGEIATALGGRPEAAALFFWAAAHWGLWGERGGVMAALRQGVARKVARYAELARRIDERYEAAGGHRILGRLHSEAPRVPLVTGWVDRGLAVAALERAVEIAPEEPLNRLYLAEALLRFRPRRRAEALALLEILAGEEARPDRPLEDGHTLSEARRLLDRARARE